MLQSNIVVFHSCHISIVHLLCVHCPPSLCFQLKKRTEYYIECVLVLACATMFLLAAIDDRSSSY